MNCTDFHHWLDEGRADRDAAEMQAHVANCISCEREFTAAIELERVLGVIVPATVHPGFNDAVMQRIHATNRLEAAVQIVANPIVSVALAIIIVIALRLHAIRDVAAQSNLALPSISFAMTLVLAPLLLGVSWLLFRTCERLTWQQR